MYSRTLKAFCLKHGDFEDIEYLRKKMFEFLLRIPKCKPWIAPLIPSDLVIVAFLDDTNQLYMFAQGPWADEHKNKWFVVRAIPEQSNVRKPGTFRDGGIRPLMPRLLYIVYVVDVDLKVTEVDSSWEVSVPRCFWYYNISHSYSIDIVVPDNVNDKVFLDMEMTPITETAINATKKFLSAPPLVAANKDVPNDVPKVVPRVAPRVAPQVPDSTPVPPPPSDKDNVKASPSSDKDNVKAFVERWAFANGITDESLKQAITDMASTPSDFALLEKGDLERFIPDTTPFLQKKAATVHWEKLKVVEPKMGQMNSESSSEMSLDDLINHYSSDGGDERGHM